MLSLTLTSAAVAALLPDARAHTTPPHKHHPPTPQVSKSQAGTGSNHAISALKFGIIKKFLQLGWSVLLSDIDVCVLQDPFKYLYRCGAAVTQQQHSSSSERTGFRRVVQAVRVQKSCQELFSCVEVHQSRP
jgi:hypothetical protein